MAVRKGDVKAQVVEDRESMARWEEKENEKKE